MKILIVGGNGHVGTRLAARLRDLGHDVSSASRASGVDALTGEGLGEAMAHTDTVVDVLNTVEMDAAAATAFFRGTTERLLAAEHTTGVRHHVLLSVVGADRALANGYYTGKVAQEDAVRDGDIPFTIVRATQFHDFVPTIADWLTVADEVNAPRMKLQPVDVDDVVELLADIAQGVPVNDTIDLAGPDVFQLDEILRSTLSQASDERRVITVEGTALGADGLDSLIPLGEHRNGTRRYPVRVVS